MSKTLSQLVRDQVLENVPEFDDFDGVRERYAINRINKMTNVELLCHISAAIEKARLSSTDPRSWLSL